MASLSSVIFTEGRHGGFCFLGSGGEIGAGRRIEAGWTSRETATLVVLQYAHRGVIHAGHGLTMILMRERPQVHYFHVHQL